MTLIVWLSTQCVYTGVYKNQGVDAVVRYQVVRSKMEKTKVLLENNGIAEHIPQTVYFSKKNLGKMLNLYPLVYVKPDCGKKGRRVAAIRSREGSFLIHYKRDIIETDLFDDVFSFVKNLSRKDKFLIQQGIEVLRIDNRPFDLRVMVQKPFDEWEVSGIMGKLAAPGKVVTNYYSGATLINYRKLMKMSSIEEKTANQLLKQIFILSKEVAQTLNQNYPGLRELGLDIGIDQSLYPWIFEVNTKPSFNEDKKVKDYHKVILSSFKMKK